MCQVEQKQRCIRVRFWDYLSDMFAYMSEKCHDRSVKINNPCTIKVGDDSSIFDRNRLSYDKELNQVIDNLKKIDEKISKQKTR